MSDTVNHDDQTDTITSVSPTDDLDKESANLIQLLFDKDFIRQQNELAQLKERREWRKYCFKGVNYAELPSYKVNDPRHTLECREEMRMNASLDYYLFGTAMTTWTNISDMAAECNTRALKTYDQNNVDISQHLLKLISAKIWDKYDEIYSRCDSNGKKWLNTTIKTLYPQSYNVCEAMINQSQICNAIASGDSSYFYKSSMAWCNDVYETEIARLQAVIDDVQSRVMMLLTKTSGDINICINSIYMSNITDSAINSTINQTAECLMEKNIIESVDKSSSDDQVDKSSSDDQVDKSQAEQVDKSSNDEHMNKLYILIIIFVVIMIFITYIITRPTRVVPIYIPTTN